MNSLPRLAALALLAILAPALPSLAHDTTPKPAGHDAHAHGAGDAHASGDAHAGHGNGHDGSGTAVDQSGLSDVEAITAIKLAMFDTPENPLHIGPIIVVGDYAVSGWDQGGMGGRALMRKTAKGWAIHLCAGAGLKDAAALAEIGVPEHEALQMATELAAAEAQLPPETVALYDSFDGTVMVDETLF